MNVNMNKLYQLNFLYKKCLSLSKMKNVSWIPKKPDGKYNIDKDIRFLKNFIKHPHLAYLQPKHKLVLNKRVLNKRVLKKRILKNNKYDH